MGPEATMDWKGHGMICCQAELLDQGVLLLTCELETMELSVLRSSCSLTRFVYRMVRCLRMCADVFCSVLENVC